MADALPSAGEAIVLAAARNGTDIIFGIPGAQIYPLFDGIARAGVRLILPRHEQAAAYMAMGYARSTGKTGVFAVVPGPGVLNASAALCTAYGNGSSVVCLTGHVPTAFSGRGRGHLHELPDQALTLKSFIKEVFHITDLHRINLTVSEAFQRARCGRPGPVAVQMAWDLMAREVPPGEPEAERRACEVPSIDAETLAAAAELVASARKPMIMCGSGALDAAEEVRALAERLDAPVTAFRSGRGVVAEDHALAAPPVTARELWDDVDLLIGIGSRLEMPYMRWRDMMRYEARPPGPKLLRIDIDPAEMSRLVPDVGVVGDAADACRRLMERLGAVAAPGRGRRDEIARARAVARQCVSRVQPQAAYLEVIREILPRDGFLVPELSQVGFATYTDAFPVLAPRTYVTEGYQGTLGFGFPTALGVKAANPDRAVVAIAGDGGFMFGVQELATAAEYGIAVVTIVFNNGGYANVRRDQALGARPVVGSRFRNPDFQVLAEAFGVRAAQTDSPSGLKPLLERALADDEPWLVEVKIPEGSERSPWEYIHMRERPSAGAAR